MLTTVRNESTRNFMAWLARQVEEWKTIAKELEKDQRLRFYSGKVHEWIKEGESILDTSEIAKKAVRNRASELAQSE